MTANFIANILMAVSLQELWGTLNILQLVLHTPLNQIKLTNVAFNFCNGLIEIVNFQIFSAAPLTEAIFGKTGFSPDSQNPLNDRFGLLGYSQMNIIQNMDLSLYIFFSFIANGIAFFFLKTAHRVYPTFVSIKIERFLKS